jgi:hypothetical protein
MELTEPVDSINKQITDLFGVDTVTGRPMYRISFSEDQYEKRLGTYDDYTREGIYLRTVTEVREVPKYKQWIHDKYIIERLTVVPSINAEELPTSRLSYECIFVFENFKGEYLPPRIDVAKIVIDTLHAGMGKSNMARYKDDYSQYTEEARNKRINEIMEYLWDPSDYADAAIAGEGIAVPSTYEVKK